MSHPEERSAAPPPLLAVSLAAAAGWPLALFLGRLTGALDRVLAAYAALLLVVLFATDRASLSRLFAFRATHALLGAALGVVLVGLAHLVYPVLAARLPFVDDGVRAVYGGLSGPEALLTLAVIAVAEEALFRGALVDGLAGKQSLPAAYAAAVVLYAVAQLGAGIALLPPLALGFGVVFALERRLSGSLWTPLATHLVWTPTVAVLFPIAP